MTMTTTIAAAETAARRSSSGMQHESLWHSPLPYLFGGIAALMVVIALALIVLACSYLRLASRRDNDGGSEDGDVESGKKGGAKMVFGQGVVVIMAGDDKPTFLAMPTSTKLITLCYQGNDNNATTSSGENGKRDQEKS